MQHVEKRILKITRKNRLPNYEPKNIPSQLIKDY